jgi:O-antigen ligase
VRIDAVRDIILLLTVAAFSAGYATPGLALLLGVYVAEAASGHWRWVPTALDLPLLALALAAVASALFSEWRVVSMGPTTLLILTLLITVRAVAAYMRRGDHPLLRLLLVWAAGGIAAAVVALIRYRTPAMFPFSPFLAGPNALGTTLAVAVILGLGLLTAGPGRVWWLPAAGLPVLLAGLIATWSRGAWLAAGVGVLTLLLVSQRGAVRDALIATVGVLILLGVAAGVRWPALIAEARSIMNLEMNQDRLIIWRAVPKMVVDHPIFGTGFGTFAQAYPRYRVLDAMDPSQDPTPPFAHNILLNFAAETGLVGSLAFAAGCAVGILSTWRWLIRSPPPSRERRLAGTVLAAIVTFLTHQLVDGTVLSVHMGFGFYALLALGAAGERYPARERAPRPIQRG